MGWDDIYADRTLVWGGMIFAVIEHSVGWDDIPCDRTLVWGGMIFPVIEH